MQKSNALDKEYFEVIIVDSKLFRSTDWSANQKVAENMQEWKIKAAEGKLINGLDLELDSKNYLTKKGNFIKLFNEGGTLKTN